MVIQPGRAKVYINKNTEGFATPSSNQGMIYSSAANTLEAIELKVQTGATQLAASALAFFALAVTLVNF